MAASPPSVRWLVCQAGPTFIGSNEGGPRAIGAAARAVAAMRRESGNSADASALLGRRRGVGHLGPLAVKTRAAARARAEVRFDLDGRSPSLRPHVLVLPCTCFSIFFVCVGGNPMQNSSHYGPRREAGQPAFLREVAYSLSQSGHGEVLRPGLALSSPSAKAEGPLQLSPLLIP